MAHRGRFLLCAAALFRGVVPAGCQQGPEGLAVGPKVLSIPLGPRVTVDGRMSQGEWAAAGTVKLDFEDALGVPVTADVWLMHDGEALQVAYRFSRADGKVALMPELFLDTDDDKGPSFRSDDWWLHLSGGDCAQKGGYDDYATCGEHPFWETAPTPAVRLTSATFEFRVLLSELGLAPGDELGLAVCIRHATEVSGDWVDGRSLWPEGATPDSPATWATARLQAGGI